MSDAYHDLTWMYIRFTQHMVNEFDMGVKVGLRLALWLIADKEDQRRWLSLMETSPLTQQLPQEIIDEIGDAYDKST